MPDRLNRQACDVTVVIPARNRGHSLARAIRSVYAQTWTPSRVIVIDDGSTDDTRDVALREGVDLIECAQSQGAGPARNLGIAAASTEYVAFLDSDDAWLPHHLENSLQMTFKYSFVTAPMIDSFGGLRGNTLGEPRELGVADLFFPTNLVCTSTVVAKREVIVEAGMFRPIRRAQDLDLWIRVLKMQTGLALGSVGAEYHTDSVYLDPGLRARSRAGLLTVLDSYASDPWLTPSLKNGINAKLAWDDLRYGMHAKDFALMGQATMILASDPRKLGALTSLLRHRRRTRIDRMAL